METFQIKANGTLLVLEIGLGKIFAFNTDGTKKEIILDGIVDHPDGIGVDKRNKHIYWTNMGADGMSDDGYIERIDFDGSHRQTIIPKGFTHTPKQLHLDLVHRLIYWCDREGMRVMRAGMDGSNITTLVVTGKSEQDRLDERNHCVGVTLDEKHGFMYWSQKGPPKGGKGRIFRAGINLPEGADPYSRPDIEIVWDQLPEPIDLDYDHSTGELYWTDRGAPPRGNSLNRARIDQKAIGEPEVLLQNLHEAIGLALDKENNRAFFGDLDGHLYSCHLDGSAFEVIYTSKEKEMLTGMTYIPGGI